MSYRVLIWGLGGTYNCCVNLLKFYSLNKQFEIIGVTARDIPNGYKYVDGWPLLLKEQIKSSDFDFVLVMSREHYFEIMQNIIQLYSIEKERIISYRILSLPNLDFNNYIKIKNSRITIFSNNCWGGMLYHSLGLECISPFKNLSIAESDYMKFLKSPKYYMEKEPIWDGLEEMDFNSGKKVPVLKLEDILIKCNHYPDPYYAIEKWNRRREKINWNNILIEMYTENQNMAEEFSQLECLKKVCFVPFQTDLIYVYYLPQLPGQKKFYETVNGAVTLDGNGYIYDIGSVILGKINYRLTI